MAERIDWEGYWGEFTSRHGPYVEIKDASGNPHYLLFSDGWKYSAKSTSGPEFPPPDNLEEKKELILLYWRTRLRIKLTDYQLKRDNLREIIYAQQKMSQSIALIRSEVTENEGETLRRISINDLLKDLRHLADEIAYCREQLENPDLYDNETKENIPIIDYLTVLESIDSKVVNHRTSSEKTPHTT